MNLDYAYLMGFRCALLGGNVDECPYRDREYEEKRAWVLGFIEGLRTLWGLPE